MSTGFSRLLIGPLDGGLPRLRGAGLGESRAPAGSGDHPGGLVDRMSRCHLGCHLFIVLKHQRGHLVALVQDARPVFSPP